MFITSGVFFVLSLVLHALLQTSSFDFAFTYLGLHFTVPISLAFFVVGLLKMPIHTKRLSRPDPDEIVFKKEFLCRRYGPDGHIVVARDGQECQPLVLLARIVAVGGKQQSKHKFI